MAGLYDRREAGTLLLGAAAALAAPGMARAAASSRNVRIGARPDPVELALGQTALLVIDMENDFGAKGGMFDLAGIDIGEIRAVIPNVRRALDAARDAGIPVAYVNMAYNADLSDAGRVDGPNRLKQDPIGIGRPVPAPDGTRGGILVRGSWGTQVVSELAPLAGELTVYKTRYSGFANTTLHAELQARDIRNLVVTGCTTSVCVESTVRDAMFLDYTCLLLEDCMAEPQGAANHAATLDILAQRFAWVGDSRRFAAALAH